MDAKPNPGSDPSNSLVQIYPALTLTFCALSVLFIYLVYSRNLVFGSPAGGWTYPYFDSVHPLSRWTVVLVLGLIAALTFGVSRFLAVYKKTTLLVSFVGVVWLQLLIHSVYPYPFDSIVTSDVANSFYSTALEYSPAEVLDTNNQLYLSFPAHARTNMPGKILVFHLLALLTDSPQAMGYWIVIFSTLGAPLLYGITRLILNDRQAGYYAFVLYALVPGKLAFFPIPNTLTPVFILLCLYLLLLYLKKRRLLFLFLLGLSLYILVLFEPSPLVTGFIFAGGLLYELCERKFTRRDALAIFLVPAVSFLLLYLVFLWVFSFDLFRAFHYILSDAVLFNANRRPYGIWVPENLKEFFYAAGLPVMLIFVFQSIRVPLSWKDRSWIGSMENIYILTLTATLAALTLLGINRGEITRLWIYLAVFFQIPAAILLARLPRARLLFFLVAGTLAVQSLVILPRIAFVTP